MASQSISDYLGGLESEELFSAAASVEELKGHPGWVFIGRLWSLDRERLVDQLTAGALKDHASYAHVGGQVKGVERAQEFVEKILQAAKLLRGQLAAERGEEG